MNASNRSLQVEQKSAEAGQSCCRAMLVSYKSMAKRDRTRAQTFNLSSVIVIPDELGKELHEGDFGGLKFTNNHLYSLVAVSLDESLDSTGPAT